MSYLAIGAVTKALIELLSRKLNKPSLLGPGTFRVTSLPPDDDRVTEETGVNLFLYRLTENQFLRNTPWAGDRANPGGSPRPPLTLSLHYILTGYAKKVVGSAQEDVTAHQLLGNAMAVLHDNPVLNDVHDGDFDAALDTQFAAELRQSFEKIKVSFLPISIDEFSKIWTGFSKAYRLSVAYEVSLVQIAPLAPTTARAPSASRPSVSASTTGPPSIGSIEPATGPAGAQVTLVGANVTQQGRPTTINVGGVSVEEGDFERVSPTEIRFVVPSDVSGGPNVPVTVTCGGFESAAVVYRLRPWISGLQPLRGITGVPVAIPFRAPAGAAVSVAIGGLPAATTVDSANQLVRAVVPLALATHGPAPVVLTLDDGTPQRSNALLYEVLPVATSLTLTDAGAPPRTTVTVTGERLRGGDVSLRYGALSARLGDLTDPVKFPNADTTVSFQFDRVLLPGGTASVLVDGRSTNPLPRALTRVDPARGAAGDALTLTGVGLSGRAVVVAFGPTSLPAFAQPFATRFTVQVPPGLAAGPTTVKVAVDGSDAGGLPFQVLA